MNIDWQNVNRVLVIRLRSIGDTVLSTPSLIALRRFLPDAQIDVLLEDWVAPVLEGFDEVDNVISVGTDLKGRLRTAWKLMRDRYDVVFNLHGGPTSRFFTNSASKIHSVGYLHYPRGAGYFHAFPPASRYWNKEPTHSAEQQLALLGYAGVPVDDRPKSKLIVTPEAAYQIAIRLPENFGEFALVHPTSAFATKEWAITNFARTAEYLAGQGIKTIAVAAKDESDKLDALKANSKVPILTLSGIPLPEITALAARATLFVGNDSGIAHIAAAVNTPTVVVFGSSNRDHWRPWINAPNEIVFNPFECQPCPGYECKVYGTPKCIISVSPDQVIGAIERVLAQSEKGGP